MTNVNTVLRPSSSVIRLHAQALSIAPSARAWLRRTTGARVLHVFERACNLVGADGEIVSLVSAEVGEGPFAIVAPIGPAFSDLVSIQSLVTIRGDRLDLGPISIDTAGAGLWQPRPRWEKVRERLPALHDHVRGLAALLQSRAPAESLAQRILPHPPAPSPEVEQHTLPHPPTPSPEVEQHTSGEGGQLLPCPDDSILSGAERSRRGVVRTGVGAYHERSRRSEVQTCIAHAALPPIEALCAGIVANNVALCRAGARGLAGLGGGLTPAGDDFLLGAMYAIWVTCPGAEAAILGRAIAVTAGPSTTRLSAAWLRAAARGEACTPWHDLVGGLAGGDRDTTLAAARRILNTGHTSGADALAGFVAVAGKCFAPRTVL